MTRPLAILEVLRPHNMLAAGLGVYAGFHVAGGRDAGAVALLALLTALATGAGNVVNDCFDLAIDRVNKPARPLPSGRVSPASARALYATLTAATATAAWVWMDRNLALLVTSWQVLLFLYASVFKRVLVVGNLVVAAVSASAFLAGAMVAADPRAAAVPCAIAFAFVVCRELVKGGEDFEGDAAAGVRTLAVTAGRERTARAAAAAMLLVAIWLPAPAVAGAYDAAYLLVMCGLVVPVLIWGSLTVVRSPHKAVFARVSRALKLSMFAGIAALVLGS